MTRGTARKFGPTAPVASTTPCSPGVATSHRRSRRAGFTLLEVALGLTVMTLVFAGVMSASVRIRELAVRAQGMARGNTMLVSTVEQLRAYSYNDLLAHLAQPANLSGTVNAQSVAGNYPMTWTITAEARDADYLRTRVVVSWTVVGADQSVAAVTDFYRNGINK